MRWSSARSSNEVFCTFQADEHHPLLAAQKVLATGIRQCNVLREHALSGAFLPQPLMGNHCCHQGTIIVVISTKMLTDMSSSFSLTVSCNAFTRRLRSTCSLASSAISRRLLRVMNPPYMAPDDSSACATDQAVSAQRNVTDRRNVKAQKGSSAGGHMQVSRNALSRQVMPAPCGRQRPCTRCLVIWSFS